MKGGMFMAACVVALSVFAAQAQEGARSTWETASPEEPRASVTPLMVSVCSPSGLEVPWWRPVWDVEGLRLCLPYGRCREFTGLDVGFVTHAVNSHGVQVAGLNVVDDEVRMTLSVGVLGSVVGGSYTGFQIGGLANVVHDDAFALQVSGAANVVGGTFKGLQVGLVNVAALQMKNAWQIGFWNHCGDMEHGGQIGVFNYAREVSSGLQIGLINIIKHNEYPCVPILNYHF